MQEEFDSDAIVADICNGVLDQGLNIMSFLNNKGLYTAVASYIKSTQRMSDFLKLSSHQI